MTDQIPNTLAICPQQGELPAALLQKAFGFSSFRGNQEAVRCAAIAGRDVLLVMPMGSGKSLCYQLPTLARGGTALVIRPLIALSSVIGPLRAIVQACPTTSGDLLASRESDPQKLNYLGRTSSKSAAPAPIAERVHGLCKVSCGF